MVVNPPNLSFLSNKNAITILHVGEVVLGIPKEELGNDFILEVDNYLTGLPEFFFRDLKILFFLFNSRFMSIVMLRKLKKFTNMEISEKEKFIEKWAYSRLSLIRKGFLSLKSICGWAFYSQEEKVKRQIPDYPGRTLNREHETPTLLFGKKPWTQSPEKIYKKYIKSFEDSIK